MNHLEERVVVFTTAVERQVIQDGVTKKYFRNNFVVEGKAASVSSPGKLSGQVGRVRFVKGGEVGINGVKVAQDAWSLIGAATAAEIREAAATQAQLTELNGLI